MSEGVETSPCQHIDWHVSGSCTVGTGWCNDCKKPIGLDELIMGSMLRMKAEEKKLNAAVELLKSSGIV